MIQSVRICQKSVLRPIAIPVSLSRVPVDNTIVICLQNFENVENSDVLKSSCTVTCPGTSAGSRPNMTVQQLPHISYTEIASECDY